MNNMTFLLHYLKFFEALLKKIRIGLKEKENKPSIMHLIEGVNEKIRESIWGILVEDKIWTQILSSDPIKVERGEQMIINEP
jgi:hypothetical protein